ncbi:MAG TPA: hypothetical protein P5132_07255, partial [Bacteroidales bacterium]|nr:hypothetical protein [Bacteroidales bacterium]
GFASQFGGADGSTYKSKNLKTLLLSVQREKMENQKDIIEKTLTNWQGKYIQVDDILLMGFKF